MLPLSAITKGKHIFVSVLHQTEHWWYETSLFFHTDSTRNLAPSSEADGRELPSASDATVHICSLRWEQPALSQPGTRDKWGAPAAANASWQVHAQSVTVLPSKSQMPVWRHRALGHGSDWPLPGAADAAAPFFFLRPAGTVSKLLYLPLSCTVLCNVW